MKIDPKKINNLTWRLEIIREQYIFIRADNKKLISANLNNNNIGIAIKLIELSNQLFDVGLNNYRKILKSMCLNYNSLNKVFYLYIKRARVNLGLAKNRLMICYKEQIFNAFIMMLLKKVKRLMILYSELELVYFKIINFE